MICLSYRSWSQMSLGLSDFNIYPSRALRTACEKLDPTCCICSRTGEDNGHAFVVRHRLNALPRPIGRLEIEVPCACACRLTTVALMKASRLLAASVTCQDVYALNPRTLKIELRKVQTQRSEALLAARCRCATGGDLFRAT